jgi:acetylornithine deacetylase/succinyl-diaminopimelate desuccinylase-like protein
MTHSALSTHRSALLFAILVVIFAPFECRRARGVEEDPLDAEAQKNFIDYLRIDTSNPPGNESSGARFLQQLLAKEGIPAQLVGAANRESVYARLSSGTNEKALLLLHHIDVVPVVAGEWTKPPFGGAVDGGYIWGRGALDIKSLGIAELMSVIELKRRNVPLARDVIFLGVADEEMGGLAGAKALLETHPELFANVGYVLNEGGTNETIVDHVPFWGSEVQRKLPVWIRLHAKGSAGHSAVPPDDGGALVHLVHAVDGVSRIPTPYRVTPDVARFFHDAAATRNDERGAMLRNIESAVNSSRFERVLSTSYRSLLHDTIAVTHISGGTTINSIPANATADIDIRLLPDERSDEMLQRVRDAVGKDATVEVLLDAQPVAPSSIDTDLYRLLERDLKSEAPDSRVTPIVSPGASDSRFFRARGIVAYGIAPFKVNAYDAGTVHGTDERIRTQFFLEGVRLTRRIVSDFCARAK